jgi:hypothetical protein
MTPRSAASKRAAIEFSLRLRASSLRIKTYAAHLAHLVANLVF